MIDEKENPEEDKIEPFIHEDAEYRSAFFGPVPDKIIEAIPEKFDRKLIATLVTSLTGPQARELKDEVLHTLKAGESQELLVEIIGMKEYARHRHILLATCWESGLDFSDYLEFFVSLLGDKKTDDLSNIEIVTIIEEMSGPFEKKALDNAIKKLRTISVDEPLKKELLTGIIIRLQGFADPA
ncbi:MAG TPA: hypothetical protein VFJ43_10565 [Bacteroidia bacterium]|nr:hypothetical protein [Bacteroidia bacterium]